MQKRRGHYLGTEVEGRWWRRYTTPPFFARGSGRYWYDDRAFYFGRYLTQVPLEIALERIQEIEIGRWHAGRWAWGMPIVKLIWVNDGLSLSSGFVLSGSESSTREVIQELEQRGRQACWENPPNPLCENFRQGFADTESVLLVVRPPTRLEGAAGSTYAAVPVLLSAAHTDGSHHNFVGCFVARR
jgi:hypothetical protein